MLVSGERSDVACGYRYCSHCFHKQRQLLLTGACSSALVFAVASSSPAPFVSSDGFAFLASSTLSSAVSAASSGFLCCEHTHTHTHNHQQSGGQRWLFVTQPQATSSWAIHWWPFVSCNGCTHTHPFNGPLYGTTWLGSYQKGKTNLDFAEARDSEWGRNPLGHMQVCTSLQTDNHASTTSLGFFTVRKPFLPPNQRLHITGLIQTTTPTIFCHLSMSVWTGMHRAASNQKSTAGWWRWMAGLREHQSSPSDSGAQPSQKQKWLWYILLATRKLPLMNPRCPGITKCMTWH